MIKVTNIDWDISLEDIFDCVYDMPRAEIAEIFGIPEKTVSNMNTDELYDYVADSIRHCPALGDELFGLPDTVEVPDDVAEDEAVDYVSDLYGFCINNCVIE